jgi:hypothetical protein
MATLQSTTIPALTSTSVTSPYTFNSGGYAMIEWAGSTSLANNAYADVICNTSGYARMVGTCYFMAVRSSTSWSFGMFSFSVSLYGVISSTQLQSDWGSFSLSHYNESYNAPCSIFFETKPNRNERVRINMEISYYTNL